MNPPKAELPKTLDAIVFADDWGRHPSSCQHLFRQFLPQHPTLWVNTIGTRAPKLDLETVNRALGKFKQWFKPSGERAQTLPPAGLTITNPKMWPWFSRPLDRRLNKLLLSNTLGKALGDARPVAVTTLPIVADLMGVLPVAKWVYYCVDDFGQWPGLDRRTMTRMEQVVIDKADAIISVSENLRQRLKTLGRDSTLITHGVDVDFWQPQAVPPAGPWDQWNYPKPWVVFWGVNDRRMDTAFVQQLANDLSQGTIIMVGPEQDPDPAIKALPRVVYQGVMAFEELPGLAQQAGALIMPYAKLPVTQAMQPLKLKEYMATGKPVIARDLAANLPWAEAIDLASTPGEFSQLVRTRLDSNISEGQQQARQRLNEESWRAKSEQMAAIVFS